MLIKSINHQVKDVFLGKGWKAWVRIHLPTRSVLKANCKLSKKVLQDIFSKVHP